MSGFADGVPTAPSLYELARVGDGLSDVRADVRDHGAVLDAVAAASPEVVLHLAAQPFVRRSFADPRGTYETNVMGTVNVLEAVRATPSVRVAICVTTDKCYDNDPARPPRPFVESDPMGGHDPYSSSKGCAELVVDAYRRSFFGATAGPDAARVASARAGNVIGGGDWGEDRLVPGLHARRARGPADPRAQPRGGPPVAARAQPAVGLPAPRRGAARRRRAAGRLELRPGARRRAQRALDRRSRERAVAGRAALGARSADHIRTRRTTSRWTPARPASGSAGRRSGTSTTALAEVVAWYRALRDGEDMRAVTLGQIAAFEAAGAPV